MQFSHHEIPFGPHMNCFIGAILEPWLLGYSLVELFHRKVWLFYDSCTLYGRIVLRTILKFQKGVMKKRVEYFHSDRFEAQIL